MDGGKNSKGSNKSSKNKSSKNNSIKEENTQQDESISDNKKNYLKHALTIDRLGLLEASNIKEFLLTKGAYPDRCPYATKKLDLVVGKQFKGYVVNGIDYFPQFILAEHFDSFKKYAEPPFHKYDAGFLVLNLMNKIIFYPDSIYKFDQNGFPIKLTTEQKAKFKRPPMRVYHQWLENRDKALEKRLNSLRWKQEEEQKEKAAAAAVVGVAAGVGVGTAVGAGAAGVAGAGAGSAGAEVGAGASAAAAGGAIGGAAGVAAGAGAGAAAAGAGGAVGGAAGVTAGAAGAEAADEKKVDDTKNDKPHAEKKTENDTTTTSKVEPSKAQDEKVWWKRKWFICTIICLIIAIVAFGVITIITLCARGFHIPGICASSSSDEMSQLNGTLSDPMNATASGGSETGNLESTSSTTSPTTTTTKAYPIMTVVPRLPIVDIPKSAMEIVSSLFEFEISTTNLVATAKVTYELNVTGELKEIQLRCAVQKIQAMNVAYPTTTRPITEDYEYDKTEQLLTIKLSNVVQAGKLSISIVYMTSEESFERISFGCGSKQCFVIVSQKLRLLVPHFDYFMKHTWKITVSHGPDVHVLTNSKAISRTTSKTSFQETSSLSPKELSFVITENFVKYTSGPQLEYYLPTGTDKKEATELVGTLDKGLASKSKPSAPSGEMFFFVGIPAMESYMFYGRNVALLGTSLLRSNIEIKQNFVWRWIFRSVIYKKVTSSDTNPTWVYDQSAVFLSTSTKSNNKDMWKKHHYGSVLDSPQIYAKLSSKQSILYEDDQRYFDKHGHVAKVSTLLEMLTSLGTTESDPLTNLDNDRSNATSALFFFLPSQLKLENGQKLDVDSISSCYIDSLPHLHIIRSDPSHVVIQRSDDQQNQRCDIHVVLVRSQNEKNQMKKEHKVLTNKDEKIEVEADFPILLSADSPSSAYGYSMDQQEFDRLLEQDVLASYNVSSLNLLAVNAFNAAAEGIISYESLVRFMKLVLSLKSVSVDEAVDMWMLPVTQSRNEMLTNVTEKIVASVINDTGASDSSKVTEYTVARFQKSLKDAPAFEIEQAKKLMRNCGKPCFKKIVGDNYESEDCIASKSEGCSYIPSSLETYACLKMATGDSGKYDQFVNLYKNCTGKPCLMPILRGLLCTKNSVNLEKWLSDTTTIDITDVVDRQVVQAVFHGLASNDVSKPLLFPYLMENWHLIHQKFAVFPALLGDIVVSMTSTISSPEQLVEFKQFIAYHGDQLNMVREFQEEAERAEKAIEWNKKFADVFRKLFD